MYPKSGQPEESAAYLVTLDCATTGVVRVPVHIVGVDGARSAIREALKELRIIPRVYLAGAELHPVAGHLVASPASTAPWFFTEQPGEASTICAGCRRYPEVLRAYRRRLACDGSDASRRHDEQVLFETQRELADLGEVRAALEESSP